MDKVKHYSTTLIFAGFILASLFVGWFLPGFYAWTDSDQSRPSPLLWQVPLSSAIVGMVFCASLPWLPILSDNTNAETEVFVRYRPRALLFVTIGVAFTMAVIVKSPLVGGGIVTVCMVAYFIRFWRRYPHHRLAASSLVACMILPYVWVVGYKELGQILPSVIALIVVLPTFSLSIWINSFAGIPYRESPGVAFLVTALELAAGLWLIRLGPKRTIAYLILVLLVSAMGSLIFYQGVRA